MRFVLLLAVLAVALSVSDRSYQNLKRVHLENRDEDDTMGMGGGSHGMHEIDDISHHTGETLVPVAHSPHHHHGMPILEMELTAEERLYWQNYSTITYFNAPSLSRGSLYVHLASYIGSFVFLYPIVLVLANLGHGLYFPSLTLHSGLVALSAISFYVFETSIEDLFPGNAFSTMTTILLFSTMGHWCLALVATAYNYLEIDGLNDYSELDGARDSLDSPSSTLRGSSSSSEVFELDDLNGHENHQKTSNDSMRTSQPSRISNFFLQFQNFRALTQKFGRAATSFTTVMNWTMFAYFLIYLGTGVATYSLYGQGKDMFNLLAHFIKGGVFFVLGLVTLARYCGAFKQKGWAWNHVFVGKNGTSGPRSRWFSLGTWSMEMIESSLILFYGSTNIFLEHLANPGGAWSAKDLQHVSIAFIFIGCGLCGVLLERKLKEWRKAKALESLAAITDTKTVHDVQDASPGFSPNPFPLVTIFWMGYLMSQHDQESELATVIHKQWGVMFVYACAFRLLTYLYYLLAPAKLTTLTKPLMPMTELIVSFGLISGGLIFMESCSPIVHLLEFYGYTPMYSLNLSLGFVTLVMAWEFTIFSLKEILSKRSKTVSSV